MIVIQRDQSLETSGLLKFGRKEVHIAFGNKSSLSALRRVLEFLFNYLSQPEVVIKSDETLQYGYWALQLRESEDGYSVYEFDPESESLWSAGADRAAMYWEMQQQCCAEYNSEFMPPFMKALAAISDGVEEGLPIEGVRYKAPVPMSGWYFTTKVFNGEISLLRTVHLYHITHRRPDLIPYLALAPGHYFDQSQSSVAFYSEEVAQEET